MSRCPSLAAAVVTLLTGAAAGAANAQPGPACADRAAPCAEVSSFVATVGDFRTSTSGRWRVVTFTVRFHNKTTRPLRLGYVRGSGVVLDDQGNRYVVLAPANVRAIGEITESSYDPKFALAPGERSDARFEMAWTPERAGQIVGTTYEGDITVRELDPVAGNQFRLGREHALHFRALGGSAMAAAPAPTPDTPAASTSPEPDACAGRARCYSAGPFVAEVMSVVPSIVSRHRVLRVEMKIENHTSQPLVLGYKAASSSVVDDLGNQYYWGRPGTHDVSAQGIGLVTGTQADPQFALRPGESRRAAFSLIRYDAAAKPAGSSFTHSLALEQLEILPSSQVRTLREYTVTFPGLTAGAAPNAAEAVEKGKALFDRLRGKKPDR